MKQYSIDQLFKLRWEQLTLRQMEEIITLSHRLTQYAKGSVGYGIVMHSILRTLRIGQWTVRDITDEQAVDIFNDITFFKRDKKGDLITPWLFFPVKDFYTKGHYFVAPRTVSGLPLYELTFSQLCYADSAFSSFFVFHHKVNAEKGTLKPHQANALERNMSEALNVLIAVLYTDPSHFDEKDIDKRAAVVANTLKDNERAIILHSYANSRAFITNREAYLFPKKAESDNTEPQWTGTMWLNLRFDLAKTEAFKGFSVASNTRIYDALDFLDKEVREAEERKSHEQT